MYVVSACLMGVNCKYNGKNNLNMDVVKFIEDKDYVLICPEKFAGFTEETRPKMEIIAGSGEDVIDGKGKVISINGIDFSESFLQGAIHSYNFVKRKAELKKSKIEIAILKQRSPSCGFGELYDGTFSGNVRKGNGVTAAYFIKQGIKVISEEDLARECLNDKL